jgi:hypothetical protein
MFKSQQGKEIFSSPKQSHQLWNPSSLVFNGHRSYFWGVQWPELEDNHSIPSSTTDKVNGAKNPLPLYAFMAWTVKLNLTFLYNTYNCYVGIPSSRKMSDKHSSSPHSCKTNMHFITARRKHVVLPQMVQHTLPTHPFQSSSSVN